MVAVDLKVTDATAEKELVDMARRHGGVLHQLVFIGLTIIDPSVRAKLRAADQGTQISVLARRRRMARRRRSRTLMPTGLISVCAQSGGRGPIRDAGRKVFVVGSMVVGLETDNLWRRAQAAGVDGIISNFPLDVRLGPCILETREPSRPAISPPYTMKSQPVRPGSVLHFGLGAAMLLATLSGVPRRMTASIPFPDIPGYRAKGDFHQHTVLDGKVWPNIRVEEGTRDGLNNTQPTKNRGDYT